ncbi:NIPSNAP family protein [Marinoscillum sp.]|uniref:NIPSNAP family protein n=1 Tax=Marinoscillum sp. TaxID=2024838 RepID=UPI003BAC8A54
MKVLFSIIVFTLALITSAQTRDYYQLKIYRMVDAEQGNELESYFESAYVPALKRAGVSHVGVFKNIELEGIDNQVADGAYYVLIPMASMTDVELLDKKISEDPKYIQSASDYLNANHDQAPYARLEIVLLKAFEDHPNYRLPQLTAPMGERIYELRSYESPTETYFQNKLKMFNQGDEIGLFSRLGFNASFYGEVLAGSAMPNLMYMTSYNNRADRDDKWKQFVNDPQWKSLIGDEQYANNVSSADLIFLRPLSFSDF